MNLLLSNQDGNLDGGDNNADCHFLQKKKQKGVKSGDSEISKRFNSEKVEDFKRFLDNRRFTLIELVLLRKSTKD